MRVALLADRIFDGASMYEEHAVLLDGSRIAALVTRDALPAQVPRVEAPGLLAPGFVDVQVNGGAGVLLNAAPSVDGIRTIAAAHRRFGTTTLLPTLISADWETMTRAAAATRAALAESVPGVRGVHFEGPYLNPARKGVHDERVLRAVDPEALSLLGARDLGTVVATIAPERVELDFIRALAAAGVRVCAGHSAASYAQARASIDAGVCGFTHLFNAMSPLASREPGMVGAALEDRECWCGIIADGYHVHDASLRIAIQAKPRGKVMLVTDAMPTVGDAGKHFRLNGEQIVALDGRCATADGVLAGSDLDMASAVRNVVRRLGVPLAEALRMAALYPACFLGLDDEIGRIVPGHAADLVLLDDELRAVRTWIGGEASHA